MRLVALTIAVVAAAVAVPAEAASSKKKSKRVVAAQQQTTISQDRYMVRDADGGVLGADPDPFIRLMIRKEGRIRDQSGI